MKRVFVLEDDIDTKLPIIENFLSMSKEKEYELVRAHNLAEALVIFSVYKEYDLGFFDYNLKDVKNGLDVAKMAKGMEVQFKKVYVHSGDFEGAPKIAAELGGEQMSLGDMISIPFKAKKGAFTPPSEMYPFSEN